MFTQFDKTIVALVMGVVGVANYFWPGLHLNVDPANVNGILAVLTPFLIYVFPNLPKDPQ